MGVWRRPGESLSGMEEKLMDDLARQAELVLRDVALDERLQRWMQGLRAATRGERV